MPKLTAVILAAGMSRRMGAPNKLLLPLWGQALVANTVDAYRALCDDVIVVTGFEEAQVRSALSTKDVRFVHNPDYAHGQKTSVAAGLSAASDAADIFVGLGDQPTLAAGHLQTLYDRAQTADGQKVAVPYVQGTRGNPIYVPAGLRAALLADEQNPGCHRFTRARPDLVLQIGLSDPAYIHDVDTPDAYQALRDTAQSQEVA